MTYDPNPEHELKTVEGNLASIDYGKRIFTLLNKDGAIFIGITYPERFDAYMRKQKIGYYEHPTVTMTGSDTACLEDIRYVDRPAEWTRARKQGSGQAYDPLRDKRIAFQGILNAAINTFDLSWPNEEMQQVDAYEILAIQKIYLKALDEYLEKGTDGINIPSATSP
jgi:hypothetical protein